MDFATERIDVNKPGNFKIVSKFLKDNFSMVYDKADVTLGIWKENDLIATGSLTGNVIKYLGILEEYRGENITELLVKSLIDIGFNNGIYHYFLFTGPDNVNIMKSLGFKEIVTTEYSSLLEMGNKDIKKYIKSLKRNLSTTHSIRGSIVMNLNPMTKGHIYLIEEALKEVDELIIFVVEEDKSVFPFNDRINILKDEMKKYPQVTVLPGGPYIISSATFPTYFLKKVDEGIKAYTYNDATIFGKYFAKELGIVKRFVGEEPLDELTNEYNAALKNVLGRFGVELKVIPRLEIHGEPVSASRVRKLLSEGWDEKIHDLVPEATYLYIKGPEGRKIMKNLMDNRR